MQPQRDMFHQATKETTTRINDLFASVGGNGLWLPFFDYFSLSPLLICSLHVLITFVTKFHISQQFASLLDTFVPYFLLKSVLFHYHLLRHRYLCLFWKPLKLPKFILHLRFFLFWGTKNAWSDPSPMYGACIHGRIHSRGGGRTTSGWHLHWVLPLLGFLYSSLSASSLMFDCYCYGYCYGCGYDDVRLLHFSK